MKTDRSVKMFAATVFAFAGLVAHSFGAVSVTASRDYVDKRTKLTPVTENGDVVGHKIGTNTNVVASAPWISGLLGNIPSWVWAMENPPLTSYSEADPTVPSWAKVSTPPYLTSFTEKDPLVGLTNGTIYIKGETITPLTSYTETDPTVPAWAKVQIPPYLTSYTETDPTVPAWAKVATPPYLTSEADPTVPAWAKVAMPPYLTSFTEEDPLVGLTNGTIYIKGETITPVTQATVEGTARQIIFSTSQYMWDEDDECLYMIRMKSGYTYYTPVTNVNALLPENSQILQYIENHKEEFLND